MRFCCSRGSVDVGWNEGEGGIVVGGLIFKGEDLRAQRLDFFYLLIV